MPPGALTRTRPEETPDLTARAPSVAIATAPKHQVEARYSAPPTATGQSAGRTADAGEQGRPGIPRKWWDRFEARPPSIRPGSTLRSRQFATSSPGPGRRPARRGPGGDAAEVNASGWGHRTAAGSPMDAARPAPCKVRRDDHPQHGGPLRAAPAGHRASFEADMERARSRTPPARRCLARSPQPRGLRTRLLIQAAGAWLPVLPPRSPESNPAETAFPKPKALLQRVAERGIGALCSAIGRTAGIFTQALCRGHVGASGGDPDRC